MESKLIDILNGKIGNYTSGINFNNAISSPDEKGFVLSGSYHILQFLLEKLGNNVPFLVDFSALPSSFKNDGKLADFITIFDPSDSDLFFVDYQDLDKAFHSVYDPLGRDNQGLFYHRGFFKEPATSRFYYSNKPDSQPWNQSIAGYTSEDWERPVLNNQTVQSSYRCFFKNKSFPFSYDSYEDKSKAAGEIKIDCQTRCDILLHRYNSCFRKKTETETETVCSDTHLIAIPLIGYPSKSSSTFEGFGAVFVYFKKEAIDPETILDVANGLWFLGLQITCNSIFQIAMEQYSKAKIESEKTAKAAIMSRNMSHNLGSHVMAYLKHHLSSVKDMLNDQILSQLFVDEKDLQSLFNDPEAFSNNLLKRIKNCHTKKEDPKIEGNPEGDAQPDSILSQSTTNNEVDVKSSVASSEGDLISHVALPFLVGLGQFISYLQERQDYIATVATDYVPYYSTVNFKDFIYDELNNDKRYARHPDRQNLKPDNILLGNIARSEGLGRATSTTSSNEDKTSLHDIVLKFRTTFNGDPVEKVEMPPVNPTDYYKDVEVETAKRELEEMRKYDVSLPGGIVGRQAVFSIIENVVRNAAKHGNWRDVGKLELTIDIFSKDDVLDNQDDEKLAILRQRFFDNDAAGENSLSLKDVLKKYYCHGNTEDNDYYYITLTDNLPFPTLGANANKGIVPSALSSLRKALIEDYVDENNQIKNSNKGMKEIRISSAWLRSVEDSPNLFVYDEDECMLEDGLWSEPKTQTPPVVFVRLSKRDKGECHLQFIICLVRPQKVAVISTGHFSKFSNVTKQLLHSKFWKAFSPREFIDYENKSFDIVVYDDTSEKNLEESISSTARKGKPCEEEKASLANLVSERESIRLKASSRFIRLSELDRNERAAFDQLSTDIHNATLSEESISKAEIMLYRHLAGWDGKEMILIDDGRAANHFNEQCKDPRKSQNLSDKIEFGHDCSNAKYRYLTHLEDREKFMAHVILDKEDYVKQFVFSEGITGNNSTDRLVRNEELTEIWFYKHLRAMKQKVAIFDERIFSKAFGLEESDLSKDFFDNPEFSRYKNESDERKRQIMKKFGTDQRITDTPTIDTKNHIGITYDYKRVKVFSIIRSNEKKDSFSLYGCRLKKDNLDGFSECIKYATLSWDNVKKELIVTPNDDKSLGISIEDFSGFDAVSIHQGLLDKLYELFNIKNDSTARERLTKDFYRFFVGKEQIITFPDSITEGLTHYFLPGMTIHSGRSKPSEYDMPQHLPFIPFSAIEHAVMDCKFSLIELLDSARYE